MNTRDWNILKSRVKSRDKFTCQMCGMPEHECTSKIKVHRVHHIDGNKENNEYANLITLCQSCHGYLHSKRGNPTFSQKFFRAKVRRRINMEKGK